MTTNAFSKQDRLLDSHQYQHVFSNVTVKAGNQYILLLATPNTLPYSRLGLVIPKKKVRRAVDRNRTKRLLRENFRQRQNEISSLDIIALARGNITALEDQKQHQQISKLIDKLVQNQKSME